jgi:hypothetical protein
VSNEVVWLTGAQITLEGSGASAASNVFVAADDTSLASANHLNYPLADLVLKCDFAAAPTAGGTINIYRQDLTIDGTSGAPATGTAYKSILVGVVAPSGSASAYYPIPNVPLSSACQFSIENLTSTSLSAGWTLKATPKTYQPKA